MNQFFVLLLVSMTAFGGKSQTTKGPLLDAKLPSVYLRYERQGNRTPVYANESQEGVWLRLHNNTSGAISLCTQGLYVGPKTAPLKLSNGSTVLGLKDGVEAAVCYDVEEKEGKPSAPSGGAIIIDEPRFYHVTNLGMHGDVSAISWIPSGSSIVFSLPKEHLAGENRIRIAFNYEWEPDLQTEVFHTIYFYGSALPKR
jgi:hypothetical protein